MMFQDHGARVAKRYGFRRSWAWGPARRAHLRRQPSCVACKKQYRGLVAWFVRLLTGTVVHHIVPIHVCFAMDRADLETDSRNLLTLCMGHHRVIGHVSDYEQFNLYAKACVLRCWGRSPEEILHNLEFQRFALEACKPFSTWLPQEVVSFRQKLDEKFPPK